MNDLVYVFLAAVATIIVLAAVLFFFHLLAKDIKERRELAAFKRRMAYVGRHYLNEDQDTVSLNVAALRIGVTS